jgi:1-acyl-sn-glycerol-3-phosphate acyltransferase
MGKLIDAKASGRSLSASAGPLKVLWGGLATVLSVLYVALLAPVGALFAAMGFSSAVDRLARVGFRLIMRTCGVKLEIQGLENLAGLHSYVLVANHQSFFDVFAVVAFLPGEIRFLAKRFLLKIPLFGYAMRHSEHIIVGKGAAGGAAILKAAEVMRAGRSICIFAEGRRFNDNRIHRFKAGAACLSIALQATCVPLTFSGSGAFFPLGAKFVIPGGRMRMSLGRPISTAGLRNEDRARLTRRLEDAVRAAFVVEL